MIATVLEREQCLFDGRRVRFSASALDHLYYFGIDAITLCDMLNCPINCPKLKKTGKPFRNTSRRICSRHRGRTYNIILDGYNMNDENLWSVSHLEPI